MIDTKTATKLKLGKRAVVVGTLTRSLSGAATLNLRLTGKAKQRLKKARVLKLRLRAAATRRRQRRATDGQEPDRQEVAPTTGHASTLVQIAERRLTAPNPSA